jgi:hypothetical protein
VGTFHVPFEPKPAGAAICVGFEYDHSGLVRVSVSDQGGVKVLKSHTLDLGRSVESNSEVLSLNRVAREGSGGHTEAPQSDAPADQGLSNFLIEQVERRLAGAPAGEMTEIRGDLGTYRELLAAGRDDEIDDVEERLYAWLDSMKSPPHAAPGPGR